MSSAQFDQIRLRFLFTPANRSDLGEPHRADRHVGACGSFGFEQLAGLRRNTHLLPLRHSACPGCGFRLSAYPDFGDHFANHVSAPVLLR